MKPVRVIPTGLFRFSAAQLLIVLVVFFAAMPFIERLRHGDLIEASLLTLVLLTAINAIGGRRRTLTLAVALALPAVLGKWINHFQPHFFPEALFLCMAVAFVIFVVLHLLAFILRAPRIDSQVLCTAVSTYLLLGLLWGIGYLLVAKLVPGSFAFNTAADAGRSMNAFTAMYFSFITLNTVGYGDITPVSNEARLLAAMEATTGMLYMTILVARLVSLYSSTKTEGGPPTQNKHA